jgi:hypothetical protein
MSNECKSPKSKQTYLTFLKRVILSPVLNLVQDRLKISPKGQNEMLN